MGDIVEDDSDEDVPLSKRLPVAKPAAAPPAGGGAAAAPVTNGAAPVAPAHVVKADAPAAVGGAQKRARVVDDDSDDEKPAPKEAATAKADGGPGKKPVPESPAPVKRERSDGPDAAAKAPAKPATKMPKVAGDGAGDVKAVVKAEAAGVGAAKGANGGASAAPPKLKAPAPKAPASKEPAPKAPAPKAPARTIIDDDDDSDDSGEPLQAKVDKKRSGAAPAPKPTKTAATAKAAGKAKAKPAPAKAKPRPKASPSKSKGYDEDDEDDHNLIEGEDPWFLDKEDVNWKKGAIKWRTLEHGGVLFPPPYAPHGVPLLYDGKEVALSPAQEEVATFYAAMKDTDFGQDPTFQKNFFEDWRALLTKTPEGKAVKAFDKCDFGRIQAHVKAEDQKKKDRSKEEKLRDKEAKAEQEKHLIYATIDGRKEKVGNFRVEPPGLFRGRGDHPKRGRVKKRIMPEDITINIGEGVAVPAVPDLGDGKPHRWGSVVHDNKVTWLAKWKDSIAGQDKCVWLAANSSWKGMSDMAKYNKARQLKEHIERIRQDYQRGMKDKSRKMQQRSVAVYLIDQLALRVGNEKNVDEEADTVGCCSLRIEHVTLHPDNKVELRFLGKDSIEFHNTVELAPEVYKLIKEFCQKKKPADDLFEQIKPMDLNEYFRGIMEGLSAKVFRTYNASHTLERLLAETSENVSEAQLRQEGRETALFNFYSTANKRVAELCNHQRAAPKNFDEQMARVDERIAKVQAELDQAKKDKHQAKIEQKTRQVEKMKADKRTKEELKNVALGTSRINYNDPRITVAWCKRHDMPITKPFNKSLLAKFTWAMSAAPDWTF